MGKKNRFLRNPYFFISILSILMFLLLWEFLTDVVKIFPPQSLPGPVKVFNTFVKKLYTKSPDGSTLLVHIASSLEVAMIGYVIGCLIGIPLGMAMSWIKKLDIIVRPVFDLLKPIPPIALIPIMMLLFGIGVPAKAAIVAFSAFIPCVVNAYSGIHQTTKIHLWVSSTFGASRSQQFWTIALPTALPMVFTGFKVALGAAWMSLVAAELLAATSGVGYMIQIARTIMRPDIIIVGMLVIGLVGSGFARIFDVLEKRFVRGGN